jgi:hypothetical protein
MAETFKSLLEQLKARGHDHGGKGTYSKELGWFMEVHYTLGDREFWVTFNLDTYQPFQIREVRTGHIWRA